MREQILNKVLELYNDKSYKDVNLAEIAKELNITEADLTKEFDSVESLVMGLFNAYEEEMDLHMHSLVSYRTVLVVMYKGTEATFILMDKYRFLFTNQTEIFNAIPECSQRSTETQKYRDEEYYQIIKKAERKGVLRPEQFKDEYLRLSKRINLMGDYWINHAYSLRKYKGDSVKHYCSLLFEVVYPYLTEEGIVEYWETV